MKIDPKKFHNRNIIVIGDVMIDQYFYGDMNRISPEASVPIVDVVRKEQKPGGAGNVAINLKTLKANPFLISVVGEDPKGEDFLQLLKNNDIYSQHMLVRNDRKTTTKTRIISKNQHVLRIDDEQTDEVNDSITQKLISTCKNLLDKTTIDCIIFQDYDKGLITPTLIQEVSDLANKKGIPTCIDPKKRNFNTYNSNTVFKPNFIELKEGLKDNSLEKHDISKIEQVLALFQTQSKHENIVLTLSEYGMCVKTPTEFKHFQAHPRKIIDVSGAGDTVISVIALALCAGMDVPQSVSLGNIAGGMVCEKSGVACLELEELLKEAEKINHEL